MVMMGNWKHFRPVELIRNMRVIEVNVQQAETKGTSLSAAPPM